MVEETIAAIATAPGEGGIGIIRISGPEALAVLGRVFVPAQKKKAACGCDGGADSSSNADGCDGGNDGFVLAPRMMHYGHVYEDGELIDEVMAVYFKAPHSYTAEDVVEIQCHGGIVSQRRILGLVLRKGARMAEPGEFTKRAFLNGRLDLSQAEAVIDLIKAKSDKSFDVALTQLEGGFSAQVKELRARLVDCLVNISVNIDYPDEDIEQLTFDKLSTDLTEIDGGVKKLLASYDTGRILSEGLAVCIVGKPNVGKSSLMNALLRRSRAIVTEIPGTTRDTIEEMMNIRGIPIRLTDTAGIRKTEDEIERIGIEKSKEAFNNSDLIIYMTDMSRPLTAEDMDIMEYAAGRRVIAVLNKSDLEPAIAEGDVATHLPDAHIIKASLKGGSGIEEIENLIEEMVYGGQVKQSEAAVVTNVRHKNLLEQADKSLGDAIEMAKLCQPLELLEIDVNNAYELLGEIIGEEVSGDIIDEVFARFCLGK